MVGLCTGRCSVEAITIHPVERAMNVAGNAHLSLSLFSMGKGGTALKPPLVTLDNTLAPVLVCLWWVEEGSPQEEGGLRVCGCLQKHPQLCKCRRRRVAFIAVTVR